MGKSDNALSVVVLEGKNHRERGLLHGELLKDQILEHKVCWEENQQDETGLDSDTYLDLLLAETSFIPAIKRWTPGLLKEVEGIAEGAGIDIRYALARQLSDEEPWFRRELKLAMIGTRGCSSVGIDARNGQPTIIAQNMDTPAWYDGHQFLFRHKGPDLAVEVFNFALAGKINLCGMNSNGLAMCCNSMSQLDYSKTGLPEDFVVRGFLEQPGLEAGLEFLYQIEHATGQNYTVAEPGSQVIDLEVSSHRIVAYSPFEGANRVYHTNHALVNDDTGMYDKILAHAGGNKHLFPDYTVSSLPRFAELEQRFGDPQQEPTLADVKAAFSAHDRPLCRHPDTDPVGPMLTLGCLIMELTDPPALHIAPGPPCSTPFKTYRF